MPIELATPAASSAVADGVAADELTLHLLDDFDRAAALTAWRDVESRHPAPPLMASTDWTEAWLNYYGDAIPHRFAVWRCDDAPVAAALLTRSTHERDGLVPVRLWHVGTAGERDADSVCVEYNALMCLPGHHAAAWQLLLEHLLRDEQWDELRFDGFDAAEIDAIPRLSRRWRWDRRLARYVDLNAVRQSGRELLRHLGDSTRNSIRQNLRHYGEVVTEWADTTAHAADIFEDLIELHQRRWQSEGQPGCYASPAFTGFHRELLQRLVPQGRMALVRVQAGGVTLGCSQLLIDRGRVLVYQGGRLTGDVKYSPGLITDYHSMQSALERGYSAFDFMAGDSVHKRRLTTHTAQLVWGVCRRPRLKFAVMDRLRQIKRWLAALQSPKTRVTP